MNRSVVIAAVALLALFPGCSRKKSSDSGSPTPGIVIFTIQPTTTVMSTVISPAIQVQLRSHTGQLLTTITDPVTLSILANPGGGILGGTLVVTPVGGIATFNNITISAPGIGYVLAASVPGFLVAGSGTFNIIGAPAKLAFVSAPSTPLSILQGFDLTVEIQDLNGLRVPGSTDLVTIAFNTSGGDLLLHASGWITPVLDLVDVSSPAVVRTLSPPILPSQMLGMVWDPTLGLVRGSDLGWQFHLVNPASGDVAPYGNTSTLSQFLKGLAFESGGGLRAVDFFDDEIYSVDTGTGVETALGISMTLGGATIFQSLGLARHPTTGLHYVVLFTDLSSTPFLATVDLATGVCTSIGDLGDFVTGITFTPDGTLYAVTDDTATTPETLFTVDPATAAMTLRLTLGAGDDDDTIVHVPRRLLGTVSMNAVDGTAAFTGVQIDQAGSYTLRATAPGLASAVTGTLTVSGLPTPGGTVQFNTASSSFLEAGGTTTVTIDLSTAQPHAVPVMIVVDGSSTATAGGGDAATSLAFQVVIPPGQVSVTFDVTVNDDGAIEGDEDLVLRIVSARLAGGIGATSTHTLTITDDD